MSEQETTVAAPAPEAQTQSETQTDSTAPANPEAEGSKTHKLQTEWSFWYEYKPAHGSSATTYKEYRSSLVKLGSFDTLEGFWKHYAYLNSPETIPTNYTLFLARNQVEPAWESYPNGGCWIVRVHKSNQMIERLWEELCFACVGEVFGESDICCVSVSIRARDNILSIWNRNATQKIQIAIGEKLKEILNLDATTKVDYKTFHDSMIDNSTFRNATTYVYAMWNGSMPAGAAVPPQFYPPHAAFFNVQQGQAAQQGQSEQAATEAPQQPEQQQQ